MKVEVLFPGDEGHFASRPEAPLTRAESEFRALIRNPRALARWGAQVLAQWTKDHPTVERPKAKPAARAKTKAPAKYNQRWDPSALDAAAAQKAKDT